jgi:hypothetical protein
MQYHSINFKKTQVSHWQSNVLKLSIENRYLSSQHLITLKIFNITQNLKEYNQILCILATQIFSNTQIQINLHSCIQNKMNIHPNESSNMVKFLQGAPRWSKLPKMLQNLKTTLKISKHFQIALNKSIWHFLSSY